MPYLNFCKNNKRVLKVIYKKPLLFNSEQAYKKMYDNIFYPAISQFVNNETKKIYNLEFFTQGVAGIIRKWIDLDCITEVDEIVEIIKACVGFNPK